ncbi:MAG: hypothetical protein LUE06_00535 [Oscillospiraceae bacterium]|nr:hypothetical protein [Oscillospiraceae bacterium]
MAKQPKYEMAEEQAAEIKATGKGHNCKIDSDSNGIPFCICKRSRFKVMYITVLKA